MKANTFYLISLGCAKNTVDSTSMAQLMQNGGYQAVEKPGQANVLIVNTCGFIQAAREESLQELRQLARRKKPGQLLIAAGCLAERHRAELAGEVPGLDGILSTRRWMDILTMIQHLRSTPHPQPVYDLPKAPDVGREDHGVLRSAQQGSSAYLKIADGCRRPCAFCSIPLIKGPAVSRRPEQIIREASILADQGVQELILIAQDTTDYGNDLGIKDGLPALLKQLVQTVPNVPWIRVLYAYPGYVTDQLIDVMASHPQILPYLDMPLQHAHPDTLARMRRPANMDWVYRTLEKMRQAIPNLALRTTFIVGYPGETEMEFEALLAFVKAIQFDRVGVFPFSFEPGTASEPLGDPITTEIKENRIERLMTLQSSISLARNQAWVGKTLPVLMEGSNEGITVGRSFRDAPEIDGLVFINGELPLGQIAPVRITGALTYDLTGEAA
ncbi:MAG TPA: 30S ribosomal protein S12 methylthiotransferase RimO [Anaerolineaceae bacterium]|jgi:ribosomal protein S12 methylthiotransferase|nr:30S ribosomal protein S12 methylthiotransferase RimO [Anaerolineaceae bacterium]